MNRDEIRQRIIEHLRQERNAVNPGSIQLMGVYHHLAKFYPHPQTATAHRIAREILQEFVNNNLLFIGTGDDQGFPWFTLTEYGAQCIAASELLPFDPQGNMGTDGTFSYIGINAIRYPSIPFLAMLTSGISWSLLARQRVNGLHTQFCRTAKSCKSQFS